MANRNFKNEQQRLAWLAFSGKCGDEFAGNPFLMENFMELEREKTDELQR